MYLHSTLKLNDIIVKVSEERGREEKKIPTA